MRKAGIIEKLYLAFDGLLASIMQKAFPRLRDCPSSCDLLEVGGGSSTLFWASRVKSVMTIETDQGFIGTLRQSAPANVGFVQSEAGAIPDAMRKLDRLFDIVVVGSHPTVMPLPRPLSPC